MKKTNLLDRFKGCLIGLAVGDYLGMPVEYMSKDKINRVFKDGKLVPMDCYHRGGEKKPAGYYTDDTSLSICIAESLIEVGFDEKDQFRKFQKWFNDGYATPYGDKAFGIGQNTLRVLLSGDPDKLETQLKHNPKKGGNGALMRCSPIGLAYHKDPLDLMEKTCQSTIITHNNEMAVWSSITHNMFIRYALLSYKKEGFIDTFLKEYPYCPNELKSCLKTDFVTLDENSLETTGYTLNTLKISLYSFLTTNNYEDCISKAIFVGGDTDTQAAVAGSLAGAYYGVEAIPRDWTHKLLRSNYISELAKRLFSKVCNYKKGS